MGKLIEKIKGVKNIYVILAISAVVIMLIIYFSSFTDVEKEEDKQIASNYCSRMEDELNSTIASMNGVGKAKIIVNWSSSIEIVTAKNESQSANSHNSSTQLITASGKSEPIVIKEIYPEVVGVIVVCEGGSNAKIKIDIVMAVSTLLDVSAEKVLVFEMKK